MSKDAAGSASLQLKILSSQVRELLAGKRIFLTGGTGLFGKWLLTALHETHAELVLLSRDPEAFRKSFPLVESMAVEFVKGDVQDFEFPAGHFDYCIHAATPVVSDDLSHADDEMTAVIVEGTKRVLEFAQSADVGRMLYVSSGAVYGVQPPELERIPETLACNPVSTYGIGKLRAEGLCRESGLDCVIARCFAFVGPEMPLDAHFAIGNFIGNCLRNEPIVIKGDGTAMRSYMYATDLAEWLLKILLKGVKGEAYNVGSEDAISIADLADKVRRVLSAENPIEIKVKRGLDGRPFSRYIPSIEKARKLLSLELRVGLDEAIAEASIMSAQNGNDH